MTIENAKQYKEQAVSLLTAEKLPVADLPETLENFLVAIAGNKVIAIAGIEVYGTYGLLRSLAVHPEHRNAGTAGKLLERLESSAIYKGLANLYLLTESAAEYFQKKGYKVIGRNDVPAEVQASSEFSHVCPVSAIVMKKSIS